MTDDLGEILNKSRLDQDLTQDQFGAKYGVSGPAIFKFEKGYVRPSLELWLRMAIDAGVSERRSVLLWLRSKLPAEYQSFVEVRDASPAGVEAPSRGKSKDAKLDYSKFEEPRAARAAAAKDKDLPKGLRDLLDDDQVWLLFKPTGHEINMLRDIFAPLGKGSRDTFREALRLIREFTHTFV